MSSYNNQPIEIILNVYDLNPQSNKNPLFQLLGIGFYHSGVEINGIEYSYGGNPNMSGTGVFSNAPLSDQSLDYKESFLMGTVRNMDKV